MAVGGLGSTVKTIGESVSAVEGILREVSRRSSAGATALAPEIGKPGELQVSPWMTMRIILPTG